MATIVFNECKQLTTPKTFTNKYIGVVVLVTFYRYDKKRPSI